MTARWRAELRPAVGSSLVAILAGVAVTVHLTVWADGAAGLVGVVTAMALIVHSFGVVTGMAPAIGLAAIIAVGSGTIIIAANDRASWLGASIGGVLVYGAAEAAWDALERRDGSQPTPAATRHWLGQRVVVVAAALAVAGVAALADGDAPVRSILIQGVIAVGVVAGSTHLIRRYEPRSRTDPPRRAAATPRHTDN